MSQVVRTLLSLTILGASSCTTEPAAPSDDETLDLVSRSSLVFDATLLSNGGTPDFLRPLQSSLKSALDGAELLLVQVDKVHSLGRQDLIRQGDRVWVAPAASTGADQVQRATWFTQTWICGQEIVVREVGHDSTLRSSEELAALRDQVADRDLQARLDQAVEVVVGTVRRVDPLPSTRESEHDPEWALATVDVDDRLKGDSRSQVVLVQFASSRDVAWYLAPKLLDQTRAILLLSQERDGGGYVLTEAAAVLPTKDQKKIEEMLRR